MEIKKLKIKDIRPSDYNPRKISASEYAKLKNSIKQFGYVEPIIYNKRTHHIVGGHQRYKVLKELYGDDKEIEVVIVDLDKNKEKALNLALNRISGEWDYIKLNLIIKELEEMNEELLDLTGFNEKEIFKILDYKLDIEDYQEIDNYYSFTIRCKTKDELNKLKELFNIDKKKKYILYSDFIKLWEKD